MKGFRVGLFALVLVMTSTVFSFGQSSDLNRNTNCKGHTIISGLEIAGYTAIQTVDNPAVVSYIIGGQTFIVLCNQIKIECGRISGEIDITKVHSLATDPDGSVCFQDTAGGDIFCVASE